MKRQASATSQCGFTLLELLVVIAILAVLGGLLVVAYDGTKGVVETRSAMFEMAEVKKALLRFHRDTGFLPGTGPFDLEANGGAVRESDVPAPAGQADEWLHSPANFWQLLESSLPPDHALSTWDPVTRRGWNGPYFETAGNGLLVIGTDLGTDGSGDPRLGDPVPALFGIADPYVREPTDTGLLGWTDLSGSNPRDRWGRPYLLFGVDAFSLHNGESPARIVSSGENGVYESQVLADGNPTNDGSIGDDLVLYLAR